MKRRTSILLSIISVILFVGCNDSLHAIIPAEEAIRPKNWPFYFRHMKIVFLKLPILFWTTNL